MIGAGSPGTLAGLGYGDPHSSGRRAQQRLDGVEIAQYAAEFAGRLTELVALPRAAVVVEDRYSRVFKLARVWPALVADGLAELQVRWPNVPIVFCEARAR